MNSSHYSMLCYLYFFWMILSPACTQSLLSSCFYSLSLSFYFPPSLPPCPPSSPRPTSLLPFSGSCFKVLCPVESHHLSFLGLDFISSPLCTSHTLLGFHFLIPQPSKHLKAVSWDNCRAFLFYFLSLRNHHSSLSNAPHLPNCCFTYFAIFLGTSWREAIWCLMTS